MAGKIDRRTEHAMMDPAVPPRDMLAGTIETRSMSPARLSFVRSPMRRCRFIIDKEAKSMSRREIVGGRGNRKRSNHFCQGPIKS